MDKIQQKQLFPLFCASLAYSITGFSFASTGSVVPILGEHFYVNEALAGLVFPAIYLGLIVGDFVAMWNIEVRGAKNVLNRDPSATQKRDFFGRSNPNKQTLLIGSVISVISFFLLSVVPTGSKTGFGIFIVLYFSLGLGCSLLEVAVNCIYAESPNISLSVLMGHTSLGIGSLLAPSIFATTDVWFGGYYQPVFVIMGVFSLCITVLCTLPSYPGPQPPTTNQLDVELNKMESESEKESSVTPKDEKTKDDGAFWKYLVRQVGFWMLVLAAYFSVGAELIFGGWIYTLMAEKGYENMASIAQFLYWFGMLFGRVAFTLLSSKFEGLQGLSGSMYSSLVSSFFGATIPLAFSFAPNPSASAMCFLSFATGLSIAILFPLLFALNGEKYCDPVTKSTNQSVGILLLADNCGGMSMPFIVGVIGSSFTIEKGFVVGPICVAVVFVVLGVFVLSERKASTSWKTLSDE